jgi:hypothetical protein
MNESTRWSATLATLAIFLVLSVLPLGAQEPAPDAEQAAPTITGTLRETGQGAVEAASEAYSAAESGATGVIEQTKGMWEEILLPMWQRTAEAVPVLVKALLLLALFWMVALALGGAVRHLLGLTKLDERAAKDWGLGWMIEPEEGEKRSVEQLVGTLVTWLILLFGFVAFFQTLGLQMVAGPLQSVADRIVGVVPNLLYAAVILFVYWVLASIARFGVTRALSLAHFDDRAGKHMGGDEDEEGRTPSEQIGRLAFYLVLVFGIGPFLAALGQEALLEPINQMLGEALGFLPNVVGAALIFFVGRAIAGIVREVVTSFLGATGLDRLAERFGMDKIVEERRLSQMVGALAYFFVLIPVLVASVDALRITAISDPVKATLTQLLEIVPLVFAALLLVGVGYVVARAVRELVQSFLHGLGADQLPQRLGLGFLQPKEGQQSVSDVVGAFVMLLIMLFSVEQAFETLRLAALADLVGALLGYLPELLTGLAVILAGLSLAGYVADLIAGALAGHRHQRLISTIARVAVLFLAFGIGIAQLGVGEEIVSIVFAAILGGVALGTGLAFGLGAKDKAKEIVDRWD